MISFNITSSFTQDVKTDLATPFAAISDFNDDGINEVLIFRASPLMWTNNWMDSSSSLDLINLSLNSVSTYSLSNKLTLSNGIRVADFNNDQRLDVFLGDGGADIVPTPGSSPLVVWSFDGQNKNPDLLTLPIKTFAHQITISDIDSDGDIDIFVGGNVLPGQPLSSLFVNNGAGVFTERNDLLPDYLVENTVVRISESTSYRMNYSGASFADVNRDGFPDLALFATSRNQDSIILLNDNGDFSGSDKIILPGGLYGKGLIYDSLGGVEKGTRNWTEAWSDVNLDGYPDLLLSQVLYDQTSDRSYWGGRLQLLINHGGEYFSDETPQLPISTELPKENGTNYFEPRFADLDGDGDQDIVANFLLSNQQGGNKVLLNDGVGRFSLTTELNPSGWFFPVYANQDGSVDLLHFEDKIYGNDSLLGGSGKYGLFNREYSIYENTKTAPKLIGTSGIDELRGDQGNNIFAPSLADDLIDGGAGIDAVVFSGVRDDYDFRPDYPRNIIFDEILFRDGTDTLISIERLHFTDQGVALDVEGVAGQAYRIYKAAFDRDPMDGDTGGLGYWIAQMDEGMDMVEVAARFIDSDEFRSLYGQNPTNGEFLNKVYLNVLDRLPDAEGYDWWIDQLENNPEKTWQKVLADFSESPENQANVAELIANGVVFEPWVD